MQPAGPLADQLHTQRHQTPKREHQDLRHLYVLVVFLLTKRARELTLQYMGPAVSRCSVLQLLEMPSVANACSIGLNSGHQSG
jgi:hypothetical protein